LAGAPAVAVNPPDKQAQSGWNLGLRSLCRCPGRARWSVCPQAGSPAPVDGADLAPPPRPQHFPRLGHRVAPRVAL